MEEIALFGLHGKFPISIVIHSVESILMLNRLADQNPRLHIDRRSLIDINRRFLKSLIKTN